MTDRNREPERKNLGGAPQNKDAGRRASREGEEPETDGPFGPDGCRHLMQEEMIANAMDREGEETDPESLKPSVVHLEELRLKKEYLEDAEEAADRPDNTLPEEPLPGKPPEPPLGGSGKTEDDRRKAEEARRAQEQVRKQNDPGKRR
jgi:hypothetical protein